MSGLPVTLRIPDGPEKLSLPPNNLPVFSLIEIQLLPQRKSTVYSDPTDYLAELPPTLTTFNVTEVVVKALGRAHARNWQIVRAPRCFELNAPRRELRVPITHFGSPLSLMPFKPFVELDPERVDRVTKNLCAVLGVPSLCSYQMEPGQNGLKGISTLLDIPIGDGKTLAYWFSLFYHWAPGSTNRDCQKIILVVGPLTALMESQAASLTEKGVLAIAITFNSQNLDQLLKVDLVYV
ncbi:hypothetical protein DFH09DRAFT_1302981 [Mycena vulgaris]|nr:hypothetical protein DFH09DRAFT_1302981 [Mycena vulgaris]